MMKRILVPLDGSGVAECALPHAMSAAVAFGARMRLIRVLGATDGGDGQISDPVECRFRKAGASAYLSRMATRIGEEGIRCEPFVAEGDPVEAIAGTAKQWNADLVVMATHGAEARRSSPAGSIASHVTAQIGRSILMVPSTESGIAPLRPLRYRRLLVPLDCSPRSNAVVRVATELGHPCEAELVLVHVVPVPELPVPELLLDAEDLRVRDRMVASNRRIAQQTLEEIARVPKSLSVQTRTRIENSSRVAHTLFRLVREEAPDLVLMSARGCGFAEDGPTAWPYGSVTGHMLSYGPVPRMIVKDEAPEERRPESNLARERVPDRRPLFG